METFPYVIDLSCIEVQEEDVGLDVLITRYEDGSEQRRLKTPSRRRWTVPFKVGGVDAEAIWAFYQARSGMLEKFYLQIKDQAGNTQNYTVRFDAKISRSTLYGYLYSFGIPFIEV